MKNLSINCTITDCKHHCHDDDYCDLNEIYVGSHDTHAHTVESTECDSFECRDDF